MKKIKAFFYVYSKSLTKPSYYSDILKTRFNFTVKYYVALVLAISILTSLGLSIILVPQANKWIANTADYAIKSYPADLIITVNGSDWTVNKPEPFIVPIPQMQGDNTALTPKNLIVLYKEGTINDLDSLSTLVLVNKVNVIYRDQGVVKVVPLKDMPQTTIDKTTFNQFVAKVQNAVKYLPYLMFLVFIIGNIFFLSTINLVYLAFIGFLTWLLSLAMKLEIGYKNSLRIAVHAATVPLTIDAIAQIAQLDIPLPLWFSIINISFAAVVLVELTKRKGNQEDGEGEKSTQLAETPKAPETPAN